MLPIAFAVVIIGGMGSLGGAAIGALIVGLADNFGKALFPEISYFTLYAPMALILAVKPTGCSGGSERRPMRSHTWKIVMVVAALAAVAIVVPNTNSFIILLVTRALAFSILVMSLDILLGYTGLASLGQAAYLGVGAYATAILATKYHIGLGWDFWLVLLIGIVLGAALAAIFGLLAIRASGVYFLMITLALGQCVGGSPIAGIR